MDFWKLGILGVWKYERSLCEYRTVLTTVQLEPDSNGCRPVHIDHKIIQLLYRTMLQHPLTSGGANHYSSQLPLNSGMIMGSSKLYACQGGRSSAVLQTSSKFGNSETSNLRVEVEAKTSPSMHLLGLVERGGSSTSRKTRSSRSSS